MKSNDPLDILVHVPKGEVEHFWEEAPPDAEEWWTLSQNPTRLRPGRYIWFEIDGGLVGRARVLRVDAGERRCQATDRRWLGFHVTWAAINFETFARPILCDSAPTRGFRYVTPREAHNLGVAVINDRRLVNPSAAPVAEHPVAAPPAAE